MLPLILALTLSVVCAVTASAAHSQESRAQVVADKSAPAPSRQALESSELYGGMVLGQTVTVAGQDFYQGFVSLWRDKALGERYLLLIRERPSARTGSVVWVEHRGRRLLQLTLPSSRSRIGPLCEQAVEETWQRLVDAEIEARLHGDLDLARDEL